MKPATLHSVTAAAEIGGEIDVLVAGKLARHPRQNRLMEQFRNAGLLMIEGAGHWPHNETTKVIAALRSFLARPLPVANP